MNYLNLIARTLIKNKPIKALAGTPEDCGIWAREKALCAVAFDFGDIEEIPAARFDQETFRIPYDPLWCQFEVTFSNEEKETACMLIASGTHPGLSGFRQFRFLIFLPYKNHLVLFGSGHTDETGGFKYIGQNPEIAKYTLGGFALALQALSCVNVEACEQPISKIRLMEAKKKKVPIFSMWTLKITTKKAKSGDAGGTHASPRVHLRRGHIREYAPGKRTWVNPCVVGARHGVIHKDYRVSL